MAELSKTARASMGRVVKETHIETTEEAIKAIQDNRIGGLFIGDMSRVDKLLAAYKAVKDLLEQREVQLAGVLTAAEGGISDPAKEDEYGWSVPYQKVLELRQAYDAAKYVVMAEVDNSERPEDHEHGGEA